MCLDITVKVMDWTITHGEIEIYIHTQITQMSHFSFLASLFVLTFILIDYFRTEWRSVSTQAVTPPEPKVDKGMHSASGRIHRVGLFKYIAAVKLLLFASTEKVLQLLENLWTCVNPQTQQPASALHLAGNASLKHS